MKPKPMSDAEIGLIYKGLTDKARKLKDPRHGDVASLGRAIIAARDAQWAAMLGEPVAWQTFDGEGGHEYRSYEGNEQYATDWQKRNPRHAGWVSPLYAIKEQTE